MELMVNRDLFTEDSSLGQLFVDDSFQCYTLEGQYREIAGLPVEQWKVPEATAIPLGRYKVELRYSKRFQMATPHILEVPGFSDIEIHPGNTYKDTHGCVLVGTQRDEDSVSNSRIAFGGLMAILRARDGEDCYITIA